MSWMPMLYKTYQNVIQGGNEDLNPPLYPIAHSTQNAHVTVTIDINGNFINAEVVDKADSKTLIPVTESSAARTSGPSPHPLNDKLEYVASDYDKYTNSKDDKNHRDYMRQLEDWCNSEFKNEKVKAIYLYLKKGILVEDLVKVGVLKCDTNGKLLKKWEGSKSEMPGIFKVLQEQQDKAFIRFRVIGSSDAISAVWQDKCLQRDFINYYNSLQGKKDFCYVSGELTPCTDNHPKKIRNTGDGGKLISSNDTAGFTYRGRFSESDQVLRIGYEISQKAHNALKWLIEKQGRAFGDKVFLLWGTKSEKTPDIAGDTDDFYGEEKADKSLTDTDQAIAEQFNRAVAGYKANLYADSELALLALDSATTGRLSITFYREYLGKQANELIDRIALWHMSCEWLQRYKVNKKEEKQKGEKIIWFFGAPAPKDIALAAYGTEQNSFMRADDKLIAATIERLLPCICDSARIPKDIVKAAVNKAFHPQNYKEAYNWNKILSITCSLVRKFRFDYYNKEEWKVSGNFESDDINYNCGRLLAVADAIESWALSEAEANRTTTAMRLFTRFSQYPCDTWKQINRSLAIYKIKLGKRGKKLYDMLAEISSKIDQNEFRNSRNLDGRMALGFDAQRFEMRNNKREE